jgi:ABC-type nitrate/sulfonate/bicarbonate transport system substrate-binding protein
MENSPSEKGLNNDATGSRKDIHSAPGPDKTESKSPNLFTDHLSKFFRKEIPERFAVEKRDLIIVPLVAVLVLGWVLIFGYYRAHQGVLGRPLQVGIVSWPGYAGGLVANNGLHRNKDSEFWKNGNNLLVDFRIIDDNDELFRQFELGGDNGGIDVMWSTVDSLAYQLPQFEKKGIHLRAFMQVDRSQGGDAIVAGSNIASVEDLKGLDVAVSMSASRWLLEHSLKNSLLSKDDRLAILDNPNTKGSPNAREDFLSGKVAAAVLWEPDVYELTNENSEFKKKHKIDAHVLVDTSETMASNLIADVMVARQEFIQDRRGRNAIKAFIKGWFEGAKQANDNPMRAVKVLKEEPRFGKFEAADIREILRGVSLSTLDDNERMFGLRGGRGTFERLFDEASELWLERQIIDKKFAAADACDVGLLKEMIRRGPKPAVGCGPTTTTKSLTVDFQGKLNLSDEIKRQLDDKDIAQLFGAYPRASFCVQASADPVRDSKPLVDAGRTRASTVIDYLAKQYDRRPSEFILDVTAPEIAPAAKTSGYIRISVVKRSSESRWNPD